MTAVFAVHFLPFAPAFRWRGYTWLALALLLVAGVGAVLAAGGREAAAVHAVVGPAVAVCCGSRSSPPSSPRASPPRHAAAPADVPADVPGAVRARPPAARDSLAP